MYRNILFISLCFLVSTCGGGVDTPAGNPASGAITKDCRNDSNCPELVINGDPWATLPGPIPSPWRGIADPSIRKDPNSERLWLSYSYVSMHAVPGPSPTTPILDETVSIHIAYSDNSGDSWQYSHSPWVSTAETNPANTPPTGYSAHEVSTLAAYNNNGATEWYALYLRYFFPLGMGTDDRLANSIHFRASRASVPASIGSATEDRLGGPLTDAVWLPRTNLSTLNSALNGCTVWTEPALTTQSNNLYLLAQCIIIDAGVRQYAAEFIGVFKTALKDGSNNLLAINALNWQWVGKLTTGADATALGGGGLEQPDVARSRNGDLILIVTPMNHNPDRHLGCRVLTIESLEPPRLRRDSGGAPLVRANITSSDSTTAAPIGNGLCSYDPASNTGVLFVRGEVDLNPAPPDLPYIIWRMHKTGVHP